MKRLFVGSGLGLLAVAAVGVLGTLIVGAKSVRSRGRPISPCRFTSSSSRAEIFQSDFETPVGLMYLTRDSDERDPARAIAWLKGPAQRGNARAQYALGVAYRVEDNGAAGRAEAFGWFLTNRPSVATGPTQNATAIWIYRHRRRRGE